MRPCSFEQHHSTDAYTPQFAPNEPVQSLVPYTSLKRQTPKNKLVHLCVRIQIMKYELSAISLR